MGADFFDAALQPCVGAIERRGCSPFVGRGDSSKAMMVGAQISGCEDFSV